MSFPQPISPFYTSVKIAPTLVVLTIFARHLSAITIRKFKEKKKSLLLTGPGEYKALGPHNEVKGRAREHWPEVLLLLGSTIDV